MQAAQLLVIMFVLQNLQLAQPFQHEDDFNELQENLEQVLDDNVKLKERLMAELHESRKTFISEQLAELNDVIGQSLKNDPNDSLKQLHLDYSTAIEGCSEKVDEVAKYVDFKFVVFKARVDALLLAIKESSDSPTDESKMDEVFEKYFFHISEIREMRNELARYSELGFTNFKQCVASVTNFLPLILKTKALKDPEKLWNGYTNEFNQLMSKIKEDSSSHLRKGLERIEQAPKSNEFNKKMERCKLEVKKRIDTIYQTFEEAVTRQNELVANIINEFGLPGGGFDSLYDKHDDTMHKVTDSKYMEELLDELKRDSISLPLNVKACVDEVVNLSESLSLKIEL